MAAVDTVSTLLDQLDDMVTILRLYDLGDTFRDGNPTLVIVGVATSVAGIPATFSFVNFLGYNFHCWGLLIIFLASILTGIGRKKKKTTV